MSAHNFVDLTGNIYGHLKVLGFNKNTRKWICQCDCKNKTIVEKRANHLKIKSRVNSCGCANKMKFKDISEHRFGHLVAKEYSKELGEWLCQCDCGKQVYKKGGHLRSGATTYCGFSDCKYKPIKYKDLKNKRFGHLVAIEQVGESSWLCQCDCNNTKVIRSGNLTNGSTTSCGCMNPSKQIDIKGKKFNHLEVIEHAYRGIWKCKCDCGKICEKNSYDIRHGRVISCGCVSSESHKEVELLRYVQSIYDKEIIRHDRNILYGQELDIYIPEKKIAIEFNGTYWHSLKDKYYHQQKTIACAKQGIQLIHIFEHEWDNDIIKDKLKMYMKSLLSNSKERIFARNTCVKEIKSANAKEFLNNYHLQGSTNSSTNIGCYYQNELIGVMTFGKPRFNKNYQYEIIRLCWKSNIVVIGGIEKIFKYFINNYNPQSILTYVDISKFTGNSYLKIGFKPIDPNPITEPNYVWVSHHGNDVKTRYQTQKADLVNKGIGSENETEIEIMENLDYYMVHDCGNLRLEWLDID